MEESHPLQIAKYAVAMGVNHKPSFNWWVSQMLKRHNVIIVLVEKLHIPKSSGLNVLRPWKMHLNLIRRKPIPWGQMFFAKEIQNV